MARTRQKAKGRREGSFFIAIPSTVADSQEYANLSAHAVKLMLDLAAQYRWNSKSGEGNNGDLCIAWRIMSKRGWKSRDTLYKAKCELLENDWIVEARKGGRRIATLFALTFYAVDQCSGKLDIQPTKTAPSTWRKTGLLTRRASTVDTPAGLNNAH